MCGIAGILNLKEPYPIDEDLLCRMLSMIRHRGPDESGIFVDPHVGLGHNRLSIIGLEGGGQPIGNEDGSLWIVYNGEAFNYIELKEDLVQKGHTFTTTTDTEVVLHLFEEYGADCLSRINGQFALAIWDSRKKELFLARDRVGIRPLFYTFDNDRLRFASEIKALFADPAVSREADAEALQQVFTFWTTIGDRTFFKDVKELQPGHFMVVRGGRIRTEAWWSVPFYAQEERFPGSLEEARSVLEALLKDAVRLRLRADVPVGAYLSGGLDSSMTSALISRFFNNRLKTFSIGFQESDFDESIYQAEMTAWLETEHHRALVNNDKIREHFEDLVWHCEKPILRTAPVPLYLLSRLVRDNDFKVVLTGEGADEVFGGYNIFKEAKIRAFWGRHPESRLRPKLLEKLYPYVFKNPARGRAFLYGFYAVKPGDLEDPLLSHRIRWKNTGKNRIFFSDAVANASTEPDPEHLFSGRLPQGFADRDLLSRAQCLEMDIFLSNYLLSSQGDRPAMAHSLEIRLPFLDYRVIDFAMRLPPHWKINGLNEKYILKQAFIGLLPDRIKNRAKQPYRAPIREVFFSGPGGDYVDEMLSESALQKAGLFHPMKVERLLAKYRSGGHGSEVQNMAVVGILSAQLLWHQYIENDPGSGVEPLQPDKVIRKTID